MALKRENKISAEFSMSSLTDIVFLLLIFFMLTSTLVKPNALNLKLPSSSSRAQATSPFSVSVIEDGTMYLGTEVASEAQIRNEITARVKEKGGDPKQITMNIVSDESVPIKHVVRVMDIAKDYKINALLATEP